MIKRNELILLAVLVGASSYHEYKIRKIRQDIKHLTGFGNNVVEWMDTINQGKFDEQFDAIVQDLEE